MNKSIIMEDSHFIIKVILNLFAFIRVILPMTSMNFILLSILVVLGEILINRMAWMVTIKYILNITLVAYFLGLFNSPLFLLEKYFYLANSCALVGGLLLVCPFLLLLIN